jgi:hypothetical protein
MTATDSLIELLKSFLESIAKSISLGYGLRMTIMGFSDSLQRRVRLGTWEDQKVSTYSKILESLEKGDWDEAAALAAYFVDEAAVCWHLYRQWLLDLEGFLRDQGTSETDLEGVRAQLTELIRLPDGALFDSHEMWARFNSLIEEVIAASSAHDAVAAAARMIEAKEVWRQTHDRDVDSTYCYMSETAQRFGDDAIPLMYERVLLPLFAWRYEKFDIDKHPWDEGLETLMYVACEAMRGHLVGPERTGDFELEEFADKFVLRFDPCGSGGRTIRGDWLEGTPARMEAPYNWRVAEEERDWNHYTKGVCLYCAHCVILMEHMPMDRFGYPVRVVDPPVYPDTNPDPAVRQKCQWTMYKDPTQVPEEMYTRAGRTKPTEFGGRAMGIVDLPDPTTFGMPGSG